jgi:hypothetical protein
MLIAKLLYLKARYILTIRIFAYLAIFIYIYFVIWKQFYANIHSITYKACNKKIILIIILNTPKLVVLYKNVFN